MRLNKFSRKSDAIANLYRAALYLARGHRQPGIQFLKKAQTVIGAQFGPELSKLTEDKNKILKSKKVNLFWAEKILDKFHEMA